MVATVTARFSDAEAARRAAVELERHGVEANDITIDTETGTVTPTNRSVGEADVNTTADIGARYAIGGLIGALVGAAVAALVVLVIQPEQLGIALGLALIGGGIAGFWLGGFWGGGTKLPVEEEVFDTYRPDAHAATLVVHAPDLSAADDIRSLVEELDPVGVMVDGSGPVR